MDDANNMQENGTANQGETPALEAQEWTDKGNAAAEHRGNRHRGGARAPSAGRQGRAETAAHSGP